MGDHNRLFSIFIFINFAGIVFCQNFVIILTDDQDLLLKSLRPLEKINKLLANEGVTFTNAFTSSPVCCPSRASILTGLYAHNTKVYNNSKEGGCYSEEFIRNHEKNTFPALLKESGYETFYAGKYLNEYYSKEIPYGFSEFYGLHGNSKYYNYTITSNGKIETYGNDPETDYYPNVIRKQTKEFLSKQTKDKKFLAFISPPSCHSPFTPEEKYKDTLVNLTTPRSKNFNVGARGYEKHWIMTMEPHKLSDETINRIDGFYQKRLETLLTIDDMVGEIVEQLEAQDLLNDTYIIFTSDNGFHLGNWAMPWDKRLPYETDIKVPLILRGPNLPSNSINHQPFLLIDLAPTILNWARIPFEGFDGLSLDDQAIFGNSDYERQMLIQHFGESEYSPECQWTKHDGLFGCSIESECKAQDSWNNTYACIRHISSDINLIFCKFGESEIEFYEAYNLNDDMYQLYNSAYDMLPSIRARYQIMIEDMRECRGESCKIVHPV